MARVEVLEVPVEVADPVILVAEDQWVAQWEDRWADQWVTEWG